MENWIGQMSTPRQQKGFGAKKFATDTKKANIRMNMFSYPLKWAFFRVRKGYQKHCLEHLPSREISAAGALFKPTP